MSPKSLQRAVVSATVIVSALITDVFVPLKLTSILKLLLFRFHVDFIKGSDVVFHFNPRFNENTIVRNSNLRGCWGPEEREGPFPFVQGRRFEVYFYFFFPSKFFSYNIVHVVKQNKRSGLSRADIENIF